MRTVAARHARDIAASLRRPYRVPAALLVFILVPPFYIFIAQLVREGGVTYRPELALDRAIPLQPVWTLVYSCFYLTLILLPIFIVRQDDHIRRTVYAYLTVWITSYLIFWLYPTAAPRGSDDVAGDGFAAWTLRRLYDMDPPFNCFPSLHVAHSFVSALTCLRVHRGVGMLGLLAAALVGVSTLFTKQHYVLDVVAGAGLAAAACVLFLRRPFQVLEMDRRLAPVFAAAIFGVTLAVTFGFWIAYLLGF